VRGAGGELLGREEGVGGLEDGVVGWLVGWWRLGGGSGWVAFADRGVGGGGGWRLVRRWTGRDGEGAGADWRTRQRRGEGL
jgi:hypothetical protein